jgi:ABC-type sugar transport system ATPase subunit
MRELRADGSTLMLVSHNLDEVMAIADTITVFRDGEIAASARTGEWTKREIVRAMIGRDLHGERHQRIRATSQAGAKPLLSVRNASLSGAFSNVNIELYPGEIVGIGGLVGSGRSSLLRSLAGVEPHSDGAMEVASQTVRWPHTPRQALKLGIALVPEDRKIQGLVPGMTAMANICLAGLSKVSRFGYVSSRTMLETTRPIAREFGFAEGRLETPVRNLSGGNQQKVLLARWRHHAPRILLVDEPTRGIDVGAKQEILATLRRLADQGLGIIMVSSELEEIVDTCERVYVLAEGRQVAHFDGSKPINVDDILHAAFNVEPT